MTTKSIKILSDKIDSDLTDFPVAIDLGDLCPEIFTDLGTNKLKFSIKQGTTELPVEIEYWDATNQKGVIHTKVPLVSSSEDTILTLSWDSSTGDNTDYIGETGSTPAQNVWDSDYVSVYHMAQDPSGTAPQLLDSTSNANHGTSHGSMTSDDLVDGTLGKAIVFDGSDDFFSIPASDSFKFDDELTIYVELEPSANIGTSYLIGTDSPWTIYHISGELRFYGQSSTLVSASCDLSTGKNYSIFVKRNSDNSIPLIVNGDVLSTGSASGVIGDNTSDFPIGATLSGGYPTSAKYKEIRISKIARSDAWIKATNSNLKKELVELFVTHTKQVKILSDKIDADLTDFPIALDLGALATELCADLGEDKLKFKITENVHDDFTSLLIHSDNDDGSTSFIDSSDTAAAITPYNGVKHSSDYSKFGKSSIYFDGTDDYLTVDNITGLNLAGLDWTIECFIYCTAFSSDEKNILEKDGEYNVSYPQYDLFITNGEIKVRLGDADNINNAAESYSFGSITQNEWWHICASMKDGVLYCFLNGSLVLTETNPHSMVARSDGLPLYIGHSKAGEASWHFDGYLDEIRISVGVARWTEDFTPPTAPYEIDSVIQCPVEIECWEDLSRDITDSSYEFGDTANDPSGAFDDNLTGGNADTGAWYASVGGSWTTYGKIGQNFGSKKIITKYRIYSNGSSTTYNPSNWTFEASNDGTEWTTLDTQTNQHDALGTHVWTDFPLDNKDAYQYYRINISANGGDSYLIIQELEFIESIYNCVVHTKVPLVSSSINTVLTLEWSSELPDNTEYVGVTGSTPAQNVWDSDFVAVYHMAQDPSGTAPQILDSTQNVHHSVNINGCTLVDAEIGKGLRFDGVSDYINLPDIDDDLSRYTITCAITNPEDRIFCNEYYAQGYHSLALFKESFFHRYANNGTDHYELPIDLSTGLITTRYDGAVLASFKRGVSDNSISAPNPIFNQNLNFSLLSYSPGDSHANYLYCDCLSELRFSKIARSDAWIKATDANLNKELVAIIEVGKRQEIAISADKIDADLTDFPVAIDLGDLCPEIFTDLGENKLKFKVTQGTTELYVEIEHWDSTNQKGVIHTKVPLVSSSADTILTIEWGELFADNNTYIGETGSTPAQNVWDSNFVAVYHMAQDPSTSGACIFDSSQNANHGTPQGAMTSTDLVDGSIGKALDFDGSDDCIVISANALASTTVFSVEFTLNCPIPPEDAAHIWFSGSGANDMMGVHNWAKSLSWRAGSDWYIEDISIFADENWHYIANRFDGNDAHHHFDEIETVKPSFGRIPGGTETRFGIRADGGDKFQGKLGEIRFSDIVRSDAWIKATNANLKKELVRAHYIARITGTVKVGGQPAKKRVTLFRHDTLAMITQLWSDETTGEYVFIELNPSLKYLVVCDDDTQTYNAVVADWVEATEET